MSRSVADVAREIAADCETDARALDGKPFSGRVVAETFGETLAMLGVLAKTVAMLAEQLESLKAELDAS